MNKDGGILVFWNVKGMGLNTFILFICRFDSWFSSTSVIY